MHTSLVTKGMVTKGMVTKGTFIVCCYVHTSMVTKGMVTKGTPTIFIGHVNHMVPRAHQHLDAAPHEQYVSK